jgi:hypothetical protein
VNRVNSLLSEEDNLENMQKRHREVLQGFHLQKRLPNQNNKEIGRFIVIKTFKICGNCRIQKEVRFGF